MFLLYLVLYVVVLLVVTVAVIVMVAAIMPSSGEDQNLVWRILTGALSFLALAWMLLIPWFGYRLAANRVNGDDNVWRAFQSVLTEARMKLGFLPIIGHRFRFTHDLSFEVDSADQPIPYVENEPSNPFKVAKDYMGIYALLCFVYLVREIRRRPESISFSFLVLMILCLAFPAVVSLSVTILSASFWKRSFRQRFAISLRSCSKWLSWFWGLMVVGALLEHCGIQNAG